MARPYTSRCRGEAASSWVGTTAVPIGRPQLRWCGVEAANGRGSPIPWDPPPPGLRDVQRGPRTCPVTVDHHGWSRYPLVRPVNLTCGAAEADNRHAGAVRRPRGKYEKRGGLGPHSPNPHSTPSERALPSKPTASPVPQGRQWRVGAMYARTRRGGLLTEPGSRHTTPPRPEQHQALLRIAGSARSRAPLPRRGGGGYVR